jgi:hypothetical protein
MGRYRALLFSAVEQERLRALHARAGGSAHTPSPGSRVPGARLPLNEHQGRGLRLSSAHHAGSSITPGRLPAVRLCPELVERRPLDPVEGGLGSI